MPSYLDRFRTYDANYNRIPQQMGQMGQPQMPVAPVQPYQSSGGGMAIDQRSPLDDVLNDQDFIGLPEPEKLKVISALDQDFAGLPPQEQSRALQMMIQPQDNGADRFDQGGDFIGMTAKENPQVIESIPKVRREALRMGGLVGGGILGAAGGLPTGPGAIATSATMAGGGYALGDQVADWLDYFSGVGEEPVGKKAYKDAAIDIGTGAAYDLGGQIFSAALMPTVNGIGYVFRRAGQGIRSLLSKKAVEESAGKILVAETSEGLMVAKNIEQAKEIEALINKNAGPNDPKIKFSWAQMTDSPGAIKLERSLTRQSGEAANVQAEQIANNNAAMTRYYDQNFGGEQGVDDLIQSLSKRRAELQARAGQTQEAAQDLAGGIPRTSPGETGRQITGELESAQAPYKSAMNELESQIPDYPMKFESTMKSISDQLASRKISMSQREALQAAQRDIQTILSEGSTTDAAFGIRRTLNDRISEAFQSGKDSVGAILMKVKAGVDSDLANVAAMARTGKISDYRGKAVNVDELSSTLESNAKQIAKMRGAQTTDQLRPPNGTEWFELGKESSLYNEGKRGYRVMGLSDKGGTQHKLGWAAFDYKGNLLKKGMGSAEPTDEALNQASKYAKQLSIKWKGKKPIVKSQYLRFGDIPKSGKSAHLIKEGKFEKGVSVYELKGDIHGKYKIDLKDYKFAHLGQALKNDRPAYIVSGKVVGYGSDGEPLLKGAKIVRKASTREVNEVYGNGSYLQPSSDNAFVAGDVSRLEKASDEIRNILAQVSPGQDVGSLMKAYNDFASSEYFSRFGTTSVKGVLQKGAQSTGKKMAAESVPSKFLTESGSDDLIRAIGKDKAGGIMKGNFAYDMWKSARNQVTGKLEGKQLAKWYNKNADMLKKYGISDDFNRITSAQAIADEAAGAAAQFEKTAAARALAADPEKAVANSIKGNTTGKAAEELLAMVEGDAAATAGLRKAFADHIRKDFMASQEQFIKQGIVKNNAFQKTIQKYQPAINALYKGSPQQAEALDTMRRSYEVLVRNTKSPIGGGSDTAENLLTVLADKVHVSRTASALKALIKVFKKSNQQQMNELLTQAFFDPEYAQTLQGLVKGYAPTRQIESIINKKVVDLNAYRRAKAASAAAAGIIGMGGLGDSF